MTLTRAFDTGGAQCRRPRHQRRAWCQMTRRSSDHSVRNRSRRLHFSPAAGFFNVHWRLFLSPGAPKASDRTSAATSAEADSAALHSSHPSSRSNSVDSKPFKVSQESRPPSAAHNYTKAKNGDLPPVNGVRTARTWLRLLRSDVLAQVDQPKDWDSRMPVTRECSGLCCFHSANPSHSIATACAVKPSATRRSERSRRDDIPFMTWARPKMPKNRDRARCSEGSRRMMRLETSTARGSLRLRSRRSHA